MNSKNKNQDWIDKLLEELEKNKKNLKKKQYI